MSAPSPDRAPARQQRVAKHLMTPGQPPRPARDTMSLGAVQRWVLSSLAATTILHMAGGLVVAAVFVDGLGRQLGLLAVATAFGVLAMVAALLIHGARLLSPWLLVGLVPTVVGAFFVLG